MPEERIAVTYHFKTDPAKQVVGMVELPEEIIRTITIGDQVTPMKVPLDSLSAEDRELLEAGLNKRVVQATKTARPVASPDKPVEAEGGDKAEETAEMKLF